MTFKSIIFSDINIKINKELIFFELKKIVHFLLLGFNFLKKNQIIFLSIFIILSSFYILLGNVLANGSNWVLNGQIALGDQLFAVGYSQGMADEYVTSTPYFPFVAFIAYLIKLISTNYQVEILLFIAVILIFALYSILFIDYKRLKGEQGFLEFVALFVSLSICFFSVYLHYASNFKSDTISLIFFSVASVYTFKEKRNYWRILSIIIFIFLATISKQQIIGPVIGLTVIVFFKKSLSIKTKIIDISAIFTGVLLTLAFVLLVKGCLNYTILNFIGHSFSTDNLFIFTRKIILLVTFFLFYGFLFNKDFFNSLVKNSLFLIPSILWLILGITGSLKVGGDLGNVEVGVILLIPIFIKALDNSKRFIIIILCFTCLNNIDIISRHNFLDIYHQRILTEKKLIDKIVKLNPNKILITTHGYIIAQKAGIKKIHDLLTWGHFRQNIKIKNISNDGNQLINLLKPDAILCLDLGCDIADKDWKFNPLLFGYKEIKIEEYRNNILFVAKNK